MSKIKKLKVFIMLGNSLLSLLMVLAGLFLSLSLQNERTVGMTVGIVLLVLSPLPPLIASLVLMRAVMACTAETETYATRDPLTGLYNQKSFWDLLAYETQRSMRQQYKFSLLLIDVDNFKVVNDRFGHKTGDAYLKQFSVVMKTAVRKGDIPARFAGDNFTAILPVCDEEQAFVVAKRIMDAARGYSFPLPGGGAYQATVSIGVAVYPNHAQDGQDLFLVADTMLEQAKTTGKNTMTFPSERDNIESIKNIGAKNIMILEALRGKNTKLVPYFQPIVSVKDRSVLAYEVLTRIIENDRVIPAAEFIEAAENMGAIGRIDYELIEQAFAKVKERNFGGTLFLNLSPKAMVINDFIPTVSSLFVRYGIQPEKMVFEITERDTVKNVQLIEGFVRNLKKEGFRLAIDDFGAGYSSFQYLRTFPVDYLKVDGEFIRNLHGSGTVEREIVSSIAGLANRLQIKTIAEFVETEAILGEVESAGIHYAQGYFIKRPSPDLE